MEVHFTAVFLVFLYFVAVVYVAVWAGRQAALHKDDSQVSPTEEPRRRRSIQKRFLRRLVGLDKDVSLGLSVASMTATWVGGGYLNGTAEAVYTRGVLYCQAPIGYAISLMLGGSLFAERMRTANAITMMDPFQEQYGRWIGLLLCLPALCGELFWTAAILAALGYAAAAIMGVNASLFIVISAFTIVCYTATGGFDAVTYTDASADIHHCRLPGMPVLYFVICL
ncbi:hypothetical protein HPB48_010035 [Haemaphysalis longicornis]|uniref:Uncharacterized protein n=1 Tax=Haemaphysalis longicornis TaxID=44386 RepID=A0A9J6GRV2_HAELO|nr:hypothetical protein HPB48_010035 [Haemaphysalis longicornis]